jgi:hypothetical protein
VAFAYAGLQLRNDLSWTTALSLTQSAIERTVFFSATAATAIVSGALQNDFVSLAIGAGSLILIAGAGVWMAVTQVGYMYDQAAARGFQAADMQKLQRSGDTMAMVAERARQGKVKTGRMASRVSRLRVRGGLALVWKETVLQLRGSSWQYLVFIPLMLFMLGPLWGQRGRATVQEMTILLMVMLGLGTFIFTLSGATSGFIELLRRMDLQKPLPFSPTTTVFWETASKAVPASVATTLAAFVAVAIDWRLWPMALAGIVLMPSFSLVLSSVILIVTLLFPDIEDATQRGFRGLMTMLGIAIAALPGAFTAGILLGYFKLFPILAALPAIAVNVGICIAICFVAGSLYAQFNPSE